MNNKNSKFFIIILGVFFFAVINNQIGYYSLSNSEYGVVDTKEKSGNSNFSNLLDPLSSETEKGNLSYIKMRSISDPGGILTIKEPENYSQTFIGSNLTLNFRLKDLDFNDTLILDPTNQANAVVKYNKTNGIKENGTLYNQLIFENKSKSYTAIINTSYFSKEGNYTIEINVDLLDYEIIPYIFKLHLIDKFNVSISIYTPEEIIAGEKLTFSIAAYYINQSELFKLEDALIIATLNVNEGDFIYISQKKTSINGIAVFEILLPLYTRNISLEFELVSNYNHVSGYLSTSNISVITSSEFIISFITNLMIIILITFALVLFYLKMILPKKRGKMKILDENKQIFEDIMKYEQILILNKDTKKLLFVKSYNNKEINNEIINFFKSSEHYLKNNIKSQDLIKEISYKNKFLLLIDGKYTKIGLLLNKQSSDTLKSQLQELNQYLESNFKNKFENRDEISKKFDEIEKIIEDKLNISSILPHKIEFDKFDKELLKNFYPMLIYRIADKLIKKKSKNYFNLSELFLEFSKQANKGLTDFLITINELKSNNLITPIRNII